MAEYSDRGNGRLDAYPDQGVRAVATPAAAEVWGEASAQVESRPVDASGVGYLSQPDLDHSTASIAVEQNGARWPEHPGDAEDDRDLDYEDYFDDDEDVEDLDLNSESTRNALEWAVVLVGAVLVALLLRASLFQAFWIPSESMETTLMVDDRVLVNKVSYQLHQINRGDVVVFSRPDNDPAEIRDLIKRVIALPGEKVEGRGGSVYINGNRLDEPYLDEGIATEDFEPIVVPVNEIFVMGDNRSNSTDSRVFGTVGEERVVGRAFVLFWPVNRLGSL